MPRAIGLDDVVAAETSLSDVDGEAGRLILRGHDVEELAGRVPYEAAVALFWDGFVPVGGGVAALRRDMGAGRVAAFGRFAPLERAAAGLSPVEGLRLFLSAIADEDALAVPAALVGAVGVAAAMAVRLSEGRAPLAPDPALSHAADVLRMLSGRTPAPAHVAALDTYLVTILDHGLNASTFTARVVASTAAGLPSAVVAALMALKGPLHGGAPGPVLDMLDAIATAERADAWLAAALARGDRLMGFGHRVYRVRDPRADVLKAAIGRLTDRPGRIAFAEAVEEAALRQLAAHRSGRPLDINVEFYTALLLEALGVPRAGFTPLFAIGRVAGWVAHVREQEAAGRIIRPQSRYVGPMPARAA
nr:citrate synthase [Chelatococcus reniformis]